MIKGWMYFEKSKLRTRCILLRNRESRELVNTFFGPSAIPKAMAWCRVHGWNVRPEIVT